MGTLFAHPFGSIRYVLEVKDKRWVSDSVWVTLSPDVLMFLFVTGLALGKTLRCSRFLRRIAISVCRRRTTSLRSVRSPVSTHSHLLIRFANTVATYKENYCIKRAPVFLSYYVFTAGIMHVTTRECLLHLISSQLVLNRVRFGHLRTVTAYPEDPQARLGLTTIMNVLKALEIVWPSAGRAWELLHGSKVNLNADEADMADAGAHAPRHKRSAEHFLEDAHFFAGAPMSRQPNTIPTQGYPLSALAASMPPNASPTSHSSGSGSAGVSNMPYYSSYDRWPGDGGLGSFAGSLSTSVLPQQYSTGFVDERSRGAPPESGGSGVGTQRYPQYWNDYSTLGQLSAPYLPMLQDQLQSATPSQQPSSHQSSTHQAQVHGKLSQQQIYLQDQYQMFSTFFFSYDYLRGCANSMHR